MTRQPGLARERLLLVALACLILILIRRAAGGDAFAEVAGGYVFAAALAFGAWHLLKQSGVSLKELVVLPPAGRREWRWVALALPLLAFAITALISSYFALSYIAPRFVTDVLLAPDAPSVLAGHRVLLIFDAAAAILFGPIAEELFFRGALLSRWSSRWGKTRGLGASALLFGILHADPIGGVVFAVVMSLLYWRTGTLLIPMACHVVHNAIIRGTDVFSPADTSGQTLAEFRSFAVWMTVAFPFVATALALAVRPLARNPILPRAVSQAAQ